MALNGRPPLLRVLTRTPRRGYAELYHNHVTQADEGADFDFMQDQES